MKVGVVIPSRGPRTGSRTYAGTMIRLLASRHTVIEVHPGGTARDLDVLHVLDAKCMLDRVPPRGVPLVVDLHDAYWAGKPRYPAFDAPARVLRWRRQRPRFRRLLMRADAVVVHAAGVASAALHDRVVVVPIPALFPPEPLPPPPEAAGTLRVLFAGRDALRKGLPILAGALRHLERAGIRGELRLAGGDWAHLRAAARWWLRGLRATRLGDLDDAEMIAAYAACDVVALPSFTEAFGLVAQEALLAGRPVVASRTGGLAEFLAGRDGAVLVPPGDARALADALRSIHDDRDAWLEHAAAAGCALRSERGTHVALDALERAYGLAVDHLAGGRGAA